MLGSTSISVIYVVYVVAVIILFFRLPPQQAACIGYMAGWLFLPVASYPPQTITEQSFTVDVIGAMLPSNLSVTKALVVPMAIILGIIVRYPSSLTRLRIARIDWLIIGLALSPVLSAAWGSSGMLDAAGQSAYMFGAWGGTWAIGRSLFRDHESQERLIRAMAWSGVIILPVGVYEGLFGPQLYSMVYGPHPFQTEGAVRYVGFRPVAFFEHGNQYGIWLAVSAVASLHIARAKRWRSPHLAISGLLICATFASQSVGAILLFVFAAAGLAASKAAIRFISRVAVVSICLGGAVYFSGQLPVQRAAWEAAVGPKVMQVLHATGRGSIGYRIRRDQMALPLIAQQPVTGRGRWDWWRPLGSHPWGLPLLLAGQFGLIALFSAGVAILSGTVRNVWHGVPGVLPLVIIMASVDAWLNSYIYVPAIIAAAAIVRPIDAKRSTDRSQGPAFSANALRPHRPGLGGPR